MGACIGGCIIAFPNLGRRATAAPAAAAPVFPGLPRQIQAIQDQCQDSASAAPDSGGPAAT
eukprot:5608002-Pyramimonas_sp.AAC.1